MELPLEFREMIYSYVITSNTAALCSRGTPGKYSSSILYCQSICKSVPMMTTCTAIYQELETVLYKTAAFQIYFWDEEIENSTGYEKRDDLALTKFNNLNIQVYLRNNIGIDHFDEEGRVAVFLSHIQSVLASRIDNSVIKLNVHFHHKVDFHEEVRARLHGEQVWSFLDKSRKFNTNERSTEVGGFWSRMKLRELVSHWKSEVHFQRPSIRVTTNAEEDGFEIRGKLVSPNTFLFKVPSARIQGRVRLNMEGDALVYRIASRWDDSDLDTYI